MGYFNFVSSPLDRNSNNITNTDIACKDVWNRIEICYNLVDSFRISNKDHRLYTYASPSHSKSRIDRIYLPQSLSGQVLSTVFENIDISDHKIVRLQFKQSVKYGPGQYVFNNTLLNDSIFVNEIINIINDYEASYTMYGSYRILWDFLKMAIVEHSKSYSKEKYFQRKTDYTNACKRIHIIESLPLNQLSDILKCELESSKKVEIEYLNYKRSGALLRAKIPNFEENEIEIAFISKIEKLRGESNTIVSLLDENLILREGTENVLKIVHTFYSDLYKWEEEDIFLQNYFFRNIDIQLSQNEKNDLNLAIESDEFLEALKDLQNNKSPGDDSLSKEFYVFF